MKKATPFIEIEPVETSQDVLTQLARRGAQKMLAVALEDEVAQYVDQHSDERADAGRRDLSARAALPLSEVVRPAARQSCALPRRLL